MVRYSNTILVILLNSRHQGFTQALYDLAASPEYAVSLREEVECVVREFGWTKAALDRMFKVDNFLRESQRINGLGIGAYWDVRLPLYFTFLLL
jgi:hypothetical protein